MKSQYDIRSIFNPMQPKQATEKMLHVEVLPDLRLQQYIWCYWEIKSHQPLSDDFSCNIASDGCIDIFVDVNNPQESYVMGFCDKSNSYLLGSSFHYMGVRFLPGMFPYLFNTKASAFSNTVEYLDQIHKKTARFFIENTRPGCGINEFRYHFDNYFLKNVHNADTKFDERVHEALMIILRNPGSLNIEKDINAHVGVSPRHLRRLFDFYIGDNIKSFIRVVRFQNYLRAQLQCNTRRTERLYYDFGYYDQAHFIKEFKNFCGVTPGRAFKESI